MIRIKPDPRLLSIPPSARFSDRGTSGANGSDGERDGEVLTQERGREQAADPGAAASVAVTLGPRKRRGS